jgi:hypothetical protein
MTHRPTTPPPSTGLLAARVGAASTPHVFYACKSLCRAVWLEVPYRPTSLADTAICPICADKLGALLNITARMDGPTTTETNAQESPRDNRPTSRAPVV